mgnify:CR=1 FL=1
MIVAIDGPAGAGKSTVAQTVARELGFQLLDTGAIYRTVAWAARQHSVDWSDADALGQLAQGLELSFEMRGETNTVLLRRKDSAEVTEITGQIRTPELGTGASQVSRHHPVRAALLDLQRRIGQTGDTVVEGRDIGTVVFPNAAVKVYLTASVDERARRRWQQLQDSNTDPMPQMDTLKDEIRQRDHRDMTRPVSPLRQADDAHLIDATDMTQREVIDAIKALVSAAS